VPTITFAQATAVTVQQPGTFAADIPPDWTLAGHAHGGYLLALAGRAAAALAPHPHVISAAASYLSAPAAGPVTIEADLVRSGRTMSHLRVRITQNNKPCLDGLLIVGTLAPHSEPDWASKSTPESGTASWEESIRVPNVNPLGTEVLLYDRVDARVEPDSAGYLDGRPSGRGELRGWVELLDDEEPDLITALFALDLLLPPTFDIAGHVGRSPTLSLSAYVRALPAPGRFRLTQSVGFIEGGRFDESAYVWDSAGHLVAQCTQLAGLQPL
jgi:hypothetical protein